MRRGIPYGAYPRGITKGHKTRRVLIICLLALLLISFVSAGFFSDFLDKITKKSITGNAVTDDCTNILGLYHLDGNADDSSDAGNDGTIVGSPSFISGQINQGISFTGVDDYVDIPDMVSGLSEITISAWVKSSVADGSSSEYIIDQTSGTPDTLQLLRTAGEAYRFRVRNDDQILASVDSAAFPNTEWHHVVGKYDGTEVDLFVDGNIVVASNPLIGVIETTPADNLAISNDDDLNRWNGIIDEVIIWNRALTDSEVLELYNAGVAGTAVSCAGSPAVCPDSSCNGGEDCNSCPADCGACPICLNNVVESGETCDGTDLNSQTCITQGFTGGTLACAAGCMAFDTTSCTGAAVCGNSEIVLVAKAVFYS